MSKMKQAKALYEAIFTRGYNLGGKTQRAAFIERAMAEIGLTKNGASTYYQNISNSVNKGMNLYHYNKPSKSKSKVNKAAVQPIEQQKPQWVVDLERIRQAEQEVVLALPHLPTLRWQVLDQNNREVHSFASRQRAQEFAKDYDMKWADRNKAA